MHWKRRPPITMTLEDVRAQALAVLRQRVAQIEAGQSRPLRELALGTAGARGELQSIEARIIPVRQRYSDVQAATSVAQIAAIMNALRQSPP